MVKIEYRLKLLRIINVVFLIVSSFLLIIYNYVYEENYYFHNNIISLLVISPIVIVLMISFVQKYKKNYQRLLYSVMWIVTILTTYTAYINEPERFFLLHFMMFLICVFSIFNHKTMKTFIGVYLLLVIPILAIANMSIDKKVVQSLIIIVVLYLGYLKSQYEYKISYDFQILNESKELILENSKEAFALHQMIFNENGEAIDYRFITVNRAFEEMTNSKKNNVIGKSVLEIWPKTEKYWIDFYGDVVLNNTSKQIMNYSRELGKIFEVSAYPAGNECCGALFEDVTNREHQDRMLKYALQRSEKVDKLKNQFLRDANHRLRTPLNGMMGMLQLIDSSQFDKDNKELFDLMIKEMKNSKNIINQMAKFVDIQGMDFEYTPCNISEIIENIITKYSNSAMNIEVTKYLEHESDIIYIERKILSKVFRELLLNAIKHNNKNTVEVEITCEWHEHATLYFYGIKVTDHGDGIAKDKLDYIFNEFYHHDFMNVYRENDNVSIPMCKQMLISCGGDLLVESQVGVGSEFTIILPIHRNEE